MIEFVHNTDNGINEEALYSIFVDIIHNIQMEDDDKNEEDSSVHEM